MSFLFEHDLFGKPVSTFPDHALVLLRHKFPCGAGLTTGAAQCGVVMEAAPSAALEMSEPHLLLEFLIVALDAPAQLGKVHQAMEGDAFGKGREPVSGRLSLRLKSRRATRTRTRAKREDRPSAVPWRHSIVRQARLGKPNASSWTETG